MSALLIGNLSRGAGAPHDLLVTALSPQTKPPLQQLPVDLPQNTGGLLADAARPSAPLQLQRQEHGGSVEAAIEQVRATVCCGGQLVLHLCRSSSCYRSESHRVHCQQVGMLISGGAKASTAARAAVHELSSDRDGQCWVVAAHVVQSPSVVTCVDRLSH